MKGRNQTPRTSHSHTHRLRTRNTSLGPSQREAIAARPHGVSASVAPNCKTRNVEVDEARMRDRDTPRRMAREAARLKLSTEVMHIVIPTMQSINALSKEEIEATPGGVERHAGHKRTTVGDRVKMVATMIGREYDFVYSVRYQ